MSEHGYFAHQPKRRYSMKECGTKRRFGARAAKYAASKIKHSGEAGMHSYRCPHCRCFHIGHR